MQRRDHNDIIGWQVSVLGTTYAVILGLIVIILPLVTAAGVIAKEWGGLSSVCGALLAWLGLSGVSANYIQARSDLQDARDHYDISQKDEQAQKQLLAAYKKARDRTPLLLGIPSFPVKQPPNPPGSS